MTQAVSTPNDEMRELTEYYSEMWGKGIWIKEFGGTPSGSCMTAAGFVRDLEEIERRTGKEISTDDLTLGDCVQMSYPGNGKTRIESCKAAVAALQASNKDHLLKFEEPVT